MKSWECRASLAGVAPDIKKSRLSSGGVNLRQLVRSFRFAFAGTFHVLRTEQNMRVHVVLGGLVALLGAYLQISTAEWGLIVLCIGAVMSAECFNSSVERLADRLSQDEHYLIRVAKDAAAGGVLMVSLSSVAVGALIFLPKLWGKLIEIGS